MDGLFELAAREDGRVHIEEVLFHAPQVTIDAASAAPRDLLSVDQDASDDLLFRYVIGSNDGFGDVIGGVREWPLSEDDDELTFGFAPLPAERADELALAAGVSLDDLAGHTAIIHGTVTVKTASFTGFGCGEDEDGDPDTSPAGCGRPDEVADGDPDTSPADGDEADSDPDTSPAREGDGADEGDASETGRDVAESDPDTSPADSDSDTSPALGDAVTHDGRAKKTDRHARALSTGPALDMQDRGERVPSELVITSSFTLSRPIAELDLPTLEDGEVLPLDLHVQMNELFSKERVDALDKSARAGTQTVVMEVSGEGAIGITLNDGAVKTKAVRPDRPAGIRVTRDPRK
jgi:hypothetical protein